MKCINWFLLFIAFIKLPQSLCLPSIQLHFSPLIHFDQVAFSLAVRLRSIAFTLNLCEMWVCSCVYIVKFNTISNKRNTNTCIGHIFCLQPISLTLSVLPSLAFSMYAHTYTHAHTCTHRNARANSMQSLIEHKILPFALLAMGYTCVFRRMGDTYAPFCVFTPFTHQLTAGYRYRIGPIHPQTQRNLLKMLINLRFWLFGVHGLHFNAL